jgi:hypothetical protein
MEEPDVDMGLEGPDVGERGVLYTGSGETVVHEFSNVSANVAHARESGPRDRAQLARLTVEPGFDGGISFYRTEEAQKFGHGANLLRESVRVLRATVGGVPRQPTV